MKGIYRNKIILAVLVIGSIGTAIYVASEKNAATDNNSAMTGSPTMESLQNDLLDYLKENHPEIRFGSQKYIDYVSDVCILAEADSELAKLSNYEDIQFYCAEYLHELVEQQVKGIIPFFGFKPSEDFLSKTIEEIQLEVIAKERQNETEFQQERD